MNKRQPLYSLLIAALLASLIACSDEIELPPAKALTTDPSTIAALYGAQAGSHKVQEITGARLSENLAGRDLLMNLYYPSGDEKGPLLIFSHGNWSSKDKYNAIIEHWVSHGYTVIAPDHLDCCSMAKGIFNSLRYGQFGLVEARTHDIAAILDHVEALTELYPEFGKRVDVNRIALTGHSFGAFTAQQFGGASALDPDKNIYPEYRDPRIRAVVALSPPGPMFDTITEQSWQKLTAPTLVTTGTWDVQATFWPDWRAHLLSFETSVPGDKYALVVSGADHYLGNLICRPERENAPQHDALTMVKITSTAFLDTYVKEAVQEQAVLSTHYLEQLTDGFATLNRR